MNVTDWNAIADDYFDVDGPEGRAVLAFIREKLTALQPKRLLDYGGGDGKFAVLCAESLSLQEIVTYDPAPRMTALARSLCADFKQIRVTEAIEEIQRSLPGRIVSNRQASSRGWPPGRIGDASMLSDLQVFELFHGLQQLRLF